MIKSYVKISMIVFPFVLILLISAYPQEGGKKAESAKEDVTRDENMPKLHKRLGDLIKDRGLKPGKDGLLTYMIDSGTFYDQIDMQKHVFYRKAIISMNQNEIRSLQFEYYQFGLSNNLKEVKNIINNNIISADLNNMEIKYWASTGESESYIVKDIESDTGKKIVIDQYRTYLLDLIYKIEIFRNQNIRKQTNKVDRVIQLGDVNK